MNTRRDFLKLSITGPLLLSFAPTVPWLLLRSSARAAELKDDPGQVLVVIQLSGGNDGLNTVIPFEDESYARLRPTLKQNPAELHKLNQEVGLHPRMLALYRLFQEGHLAVVQGVGSPDQSRDHERAMRSWQTARLEPGGMDAGWAGGAADQLWERSRSAATGAYVGNIAQPFGVNAAQAVVPSIRGDRATQLFAAVPADSAGTRPAGTDSNPLLRHVTTVMAESRRSNSRLEKVLNPSGTELGYPAFGLAQDLRIIANLIRADAGIRIFYAELGGGGIGGFDNHANQLGNHCALLQQLSESVAAFASDLSKDRLFGRVLLMTFSEFGRTVAENGRRGTDHGNAAPVFLAGGSLRAGIHGTHPSLTDLDSGALKHHTDFRSVYAAVLQDWLQIPAQAILGGEFARLKLV